MNYALIKNNKVENIIVADEEFVALIADQWDHIELINQDGGQIPGIDWTWDGFKFIEPPAPAVEPPTVEEIQASMISAVQAMLDAKSKERGYDGILSACSYASSTNPKFAAEGQACVEWRDAVWSKCYEILGDVVAEKREIPTVEELIDMLPKMQWGV